MSPSQYPSSKLRLFLFFFFPPLFFFLSFFFSGLVFLMVWCIESVNERASLGPEPAQETGGSRQRVVPAQRRRGEEGRRRPTLGAGATCWGWQKPRGIHLSEVFAISAQRCTEPSTNPLRKVGRCWSCSELGYLCRFLGNSQQPFPAAPF